MTPEQIQQILEYIKNTGELLVTSGFQLAVKRVLFLGVKSSVYSLLTGILFFISVKYAIKFGKELRKDDKKHHLSRDEGDAYAVGMIVLMIFSGFMILISTYNVVNALDYFLNPEWNAIKLMIDLAGIGG